jgi:hypothetical protein
VSYTDVGKEAKRTGKTLPRDARRLDPVPERKPPGAAKPHRKEDKPYGLEYSRRRLKFGNTIWEAQVHRKWFAKRSSRDQALAAHNRGSLGMSDWFTEAVAVERS